jgi:2,3-bisphosphoglycerate-dependent phosphoglycerate mutase
MDNKLILLRHGESKWNLENRFTGWTDVELTKNGEREAKKAGILLAKSNINIKVIFTSFLKRAINTNEICLNQLKNGNFDVYKDWRLNERHYGSLQGLSKSDTSKKFGEKQVKIWRRSYNVSPPKISGNDKRHPKFDKLYKKINSNELPSGESLEDTLNRVKPLWINKILPLLKKENNLMIVAHGNSLRAIVKMLKNMDDDEIIELNIPTGAPYIFNLSEDNNVIKDFYL